jgi:hypothetical protein
MRKMIESCPSCGGDLAITEVSCTACYTVVRSHYAPCPFCRLSPEDSAFLLSFVSNRGNVKEMERELGVSYWSIRSRLNEVIAALGLEPGDDAAPPPPPAADRTAILAAVRRGELSPAEAAERLRQPR